MNCQQMGRLSLFMLVAYLLINSWDSIFAQNDLRRRFIDEAPNAWEQMSVGDNEFRVKFKYVNRSPGGQAMEIDYELFYKNGHCLQEETHFASPENKTTNVYGFNDKYEFQLRGNGKNNWVLVETNDFDPGDPAVPIRRLASNALLLKYGAVMLPYLVPIGILDIDSARCKVGKVQAIQENGMTLVHVELVLDYDDFLQHETALSQTRGPVFMTQHFKSASLFFDASNSWLPVRGIVNEKNGNYWDLKWSFAEQNGRMVPKEMIQDYSSEGVVVYKNFAYDFNSIPAGRFRLTHYGLPEPQGANRSWPVWIWILAFGIVFVLIGICARRVHR